MGPVAEKVKWSEEGYRQRMLTFSYNVLNKFTLFSIVKENIVSKQVRVN